MSKSSTFIISSIIIIKKQRKMTSLLWWQSRKKSKSGHDFKIKSWWKKRHFGKAVFRSKGKDAKKRFFKKKSRWRSKNMPPTLTQKQRLSLCKKAEAVNRAMPDANIKQVSRALCKKPKAKSLAQIACTKVANTGMVMFASPHHLPVWRQWRGCRWDTRGAKTANRSNYASSVLLRKAKINW